MKRDDDITPRYPRFRVVAPVGAVALVAIVVLGPLGRGAGPDPISDTGARADASSAPSADDASDEASPGERSDFEGATQGDAASEEPLIGDAVDEGSTASTESGSPAATADAAVATRPPTGGGPADNPVAGPAASPISSPRPADVSGTPGASPGTSSPPPAPAPSGATPTTTSPTPTPTTTAPTTTTTTAPAPAGASYPAPGTVGYRGAVSALRVINSDATAPAGSNWNDQYQYLEVTANNFTLDGVFVKGGIDFYGSGTLAIRNSIVEFGHGNPTTIIGRTHGSTMDVRDSTLRWRAGGHPDWDSGGGALQITTQVRIIALRNDISGTADGIQAAGDDTRIEGNWIHDLALVGSYPNNTHNDGIQVYDGDRIVIANNRIDIGFDGQHQNAALFFQPGGGNAIPSVEIRGNYLSGGGFTLRLEGPTTNAQITNNVFVRAPGSWGDYYANNGATIGKWSGNTRPDGSVV